MYSCYDMCILWIKIIRCSTIHKIKAQYYIYTEYKIYSVKKYAIQKRYTIITVIIFCQLTMTNSNILPFVASNGKTLQSAMPINQPKKQIGWVHVLTSPLVP